jgi:hypothetical protein
MTHFLSRLVDRARGTALRVEPIIAPRFAPTDLLGAEILPEITTEIESPAASPPSGPKPVPPRTETRSVEEKRSSRAADAHDAEETRIEIVMEPLLVPQVQERVHSLVVRHADTPREILEESRGTAAAQLQVAKSKSPRGTAAAAQPVAKRQSQRGNLKRSTLSPLKQGDDALRFPAEPRAQAPIVRVTIGRIEVRAAPAPAPPPRKPARAPGPVLTLDAYLKSRKEGAR